MDRIIELTQELKDELDKLPLFQEYKSLKKEIEESSEIKALKKEIVRAKNENRLDDHKALLKEYDNHPLVANFNIIEEEVKNYLKQISEILNKK